MLATSVLISGGAVVSSLTARLAVTGNGGGTGGTRAAMREGGSEGAWASWGTAVYGCFGPHPVSSASNIASAASALPDLMVRTFLVGSHHPGEQARWESRVLWHPKLRAVPNRQK